MKNKLTEKQINTLKGIGLTDSQIKLYLAALEKGLLSALELSRSTKINRQQVYVQAEKLVELGLFDITRKQRKKYIPADPSRLVELSKKKISELQNVSDKLLDITSILKSVPSDKKSKIVTRFFEGHKKVEEAYEKELAQSKNTEILSLAGLIDEIFRYFPEKYWDRWNQEFARHNSSTRMIVHNSDAAKSFSRKGGEYKMETRYLNNFSLKVNIDIFNNVVLVVSYADELTVWIESDIVAQSYRIMFELLWQQGKKFENI
ncbi:MAG: helix-turn-helix domain-containing protein [Parcubacteria group bacterium]|jgi:sugar-specific transcriptional regulator TrmB